MMAYQTLIEEMEDELFDQCIMGAVNPSREILMKKYFSDSLPFVFKEGNEPLRLFTQMYPDGHTELVPCPSVPR